MYNNRQFAVFSTTELPLVNFSEVLETSAATVRISVDGTLTFVKWEGDEPPASIKALTTVKGYYTYDEMLELLSSPEWRSVKQDGNL